MVAGRDSQKGCLERDNHADRGGVQQKKKELTPRKKVMGMTSFRSR